MPRSLTLRAFLPIAVAVVWAAAMLALTIMHETPVGNLEGRAIAADTGRPIAGARIYVENNAPWDSEEHISRWTDTREDGSFSLRDLPQGNYDLSIQTEAHSMRPFSVRILEAQTESLNLELSPSKPFLNLNTSQQSFRPDDKPSLSLHGFTSSDYVAITLYRIDPDKLMLPEGKNIRRILTQSYDWPKITPEQLAGNRVIESRQTIRVQITNRDNEGVYHQQVSLPRPRPGVYLLTASADRLQSVSWISVTDISLVVKECGADILAYVTRSTTGQPTRGAQLKVYEAERAVAGGLTGPDGLWRGAARTRPAGQENRFILARLGDSAAFLTTYAYEPEASSITIYTYTDRPVYRPGHEVHFKGIVRKFEEDSYRMPKGGEARVEVRDRRNSLVYAGSHALNRFGSFNGSFTLPQYAATGSYDITCTFAGRAQTASFSVAEYRKPEFSVVVRTPKKRYVRGETVTAKIEANYYFGAPVVGAKVSYWVSRSDYWFFPDEEFADYEPDYDYEEYNGYGETTVQGEVTTGSDGSAEIRFPAHWPVGQSDYITDQEFTIGVSATDQSGGSADGEGKVIATQGEFALNVEPQQYLGSPGATAGFDISTVGYDNRPQAGVRVDVTASRLSWREDGERRVEVADDTVVTGAQGRAVFRFKPAREGSYIIRAVCRDNGGNLIKTCSWIWVPGHGDFAGYNYPDLQIVLDKKVYNPGDTAKLLINTSEKGVTALITVEGRRIFDYKIVQLDRKSTVVEIPIKAAYRPNFYIGVAYSKGGRAKTQEARARVSLNERTLKLTVTPDRKKYEPGQKATYLIKAADSKGRPVVAEVSLGVVDEAIYAIREDDTTPIRDFFYARQPNSVSTWISTADVYLSGDKAGYAGKIRTEFKDTAFWRADLVTDAKGEARVTFKLPDNLTTWRATARACAPDTKVGQTISKVVCSKKFLVRLEAPRFLIQKDEAVIAALVHNYLRDDQEVVVGLQAPGLDVQGGTSQTVTVPAGGMQRVEWRVSAHRIGNLKVMAFAACPVAKDAVQITVPVRPHGQRQVETRSGWLSDSSLHVRLLVRGDAVPGASKIRIRLAPSLASAMLGSLDYLAQYPYGCTEQTMSCFLPDVVIWRTLKSLRIPNPQLERSLPDMVGRGLNRLYDFQHDSGAWGWCEYCEDDLWMTAYVVYGLLTARDSGFSVNKDVLDSGISALERLASAQKKANYDTLYVSYVLALAGRDEKARGLLRIALLSRKMPPRDTALAAMTLAEIGDRKRARSYLTRLWKQAEVTAGEIHWSGVYDDWYMEGPTETTALGLMAAVKLTPGEKRIPSVIRWILRQRSMNHWNSTRDTALILYALSEYLAGTRELQPDFTASVLLRGKQIQTVRFDRRSVFALEREIVIPSRAVRRGSNEIAIRAAGPGTLYYTVELSQYVERKTGFKTVTEAGITVTREYRKLVPTWNSGYGADRLEPAQNATSDFRVGDNVQVTVMVNSPKRYGRMLVEDYLPAGCEAFDRGRMEPWEWNYWWVDKDVRDERVCFYVETLPKGKSVLEYQIRAREPGAYHAMPSLVQAMYDPMITASGIEDTVTIR